MVGGGPVTGWTDSVYPVDGSGDLVYTESMTNHTKSLARRRHELSTAFATVAGYQKLLDLAVELKMESEIDRLTSSLHEFEADLEDQMESALLAGYDPEDFEDFG